MGNVEATLIDELITDLKQGIANIPPFQLRFQEICLMPPEQRPRMIWARYAAEAAFDELVETVESGVGKHVELQKDHPSNWPHITLARFKQFRATHVLDLSLKRSPELLNVDQCILWSSHLAADGPTYQPLATLPLMDAG